MWRCDSPSVRARLKDRVSFRVRVGFELGLGTVRYIFLTGHLSEKFCFIKILLDTKLLRVSISLQKMKSKFEFWVFYQIFMVSRTGQSN